MADEPWEWEKTRVDADGHERREVCQGLAECPVCGRDVELIAQTESWVQDADGFWRHQDYGPAQGVCCQRLMAGWYEGGFVFDLRPGCRDS